MDAATLFKWNRFDLPAKYLYAKFREKDINSTFGLELYKEHLRVWNNFVEYNNPHKNSFEKFKEVFDSLLDDVKTSGFDGDKSKIVINDQNYLLNGAHRTTACFLYKKDVVTTTIGSGQANCDYNLFKGNGLSEFYMDSMAYELSKLNKQMLVVTIFPSAPGHDTEIETIIKKAGNIAYKKHVHLNENGAFNLMRQLYYNESWAGGWGNNFAGFRDKARFCFPNYSPVKVYLVEFTDISQAHPIKQQIRSIFNIGNHSVHINDSHAETIRAARVLFNKNSIHFMNKSKLKHYQGFEDQLNYFKTYIINNGLDSEDYCVSASSILSMYGLREGNDLDYLHKGPEITGHRLVHSHNKYGQGRYHTHKDNIIYNPENHFYFNDIKFASLNTIKLLKEKRGEPKDITDVRLLQGVE